MNPFTKLVAALTGAVLALAWGGWVAAGALILGVLAALLAGRARETIERHYSTEVVCGQLSAIYRELAGTQ